MSGLKEQLLLEINHLQPQMTAISRDIHTHPELGNQEYYAWERLTSFLEHTGWQVEKKLPGMPTAFIARFGSRSGPAIGYLAEYDALPEIGHGCGHNLICAASIGAAVALSRAAASLGGQILILGTPAEETNGGKINLLEQGYFHNLDAVLMFHPGVSNVIHFSSLALEALEVTFSGKMSHAAIAGPGGDTLEALLQFFFWLNHWKKGLDPLCQVQGVIKEGGHVPNIRPARTMARFYLRAPADHELDQLVNQFTEQAYKMARLTGTRVLVESFENRYQPFKSNGALARAFVDNLKRFNIYTSAGLSQGLGSMDIGNVSQIVPAIHPYLSLPGSPQTLHSAEFAAAAGSEWGERLVLLAAQTLALTGLDVLSKEGLRKQIWQEHRQDSFYKKFMLSF